jgi:hypothetical protein
MDSMDHYASRGAGRLLSDWMPAHVVETFLPHQTRANTPYGVESISSGAVEVWRTLRREPNAFTVVGNLGLACEPMGLSLGSDLGPARERRAFFEGLAERVQHGALELHLSIGMRDDHLAKNEALYRELVNAGMFAPDAPIAYSRCMRADLKPNPYHCISERPGFRTYPNVGHHYGYLLVSLEPALRLDLDALARQTAAGEGSADARR